MKDKETISWGEESMELKHLAPKYNKKPRF